MHWELTIPVRSKSDVHPAIAMLLEESISKARSEVYSWNPPIVRGNYVVVAVG